MVVNKRKKVVKYRAHTTHGGGHRKKRRGAGSRGGRGRAGSGKRAGHKRFLYVNELGKRGFTSKRVNGSGKTLNLSDLTETFVKNLVAAGKVVKENNFYLIDLNKLGYDKLLGAGNTSLKLKIKVSSSSSKAEEKIKATGGEVIILGSQKKVKEAEAEEIKGKNIDSKESKKESKKEEAVEERKTKEKAGSEVKSQK